LTAAPPLNPEQLPSDFYPIALRPPTEKRKVFHLSMTIAFNWPAVGAKEASDGVERRSVDQANDPQTAVARDGAPCR
jgi:hypothetical protein